MTAPTKTEGELQCDALLRATDMRESQLIAAAVAETIRGKGPQGRGAIIVGLVHVLLTACDDAKMQAQAEGAIELIRRAVRKRLSTGVPS